MSSGVVDLCDSSDDEGSTNAGTSASAAPSGSASAAAAAAPSGRKRPRSPASDSDGRGTNSAISGRASGSSSTNAKNGSGRDGATKALEEESDDDDLEIIAKDDGSTDGKGLERTPSDEGSSSKENGGTAAASAAHKQPAKQQQQRQQRYESSSYGYNDDDSDSDDSLPSSSGLHSGKPCSSSALGPSAAAASLSSAAASSPHGERKCESHGTRMDRQKSGQTERKSDDISKGGDGGVIELLNDSESDREAAEQEYATKTSGSVGTDGQSSAAAAAAKSNSAFDWDSDGDEDDAGNEGSAAKGLDASLGSRNDGGKKKAPAAPAAAAAPSSSSAVYSLLSDEEDEDSDRKMPSAASASENIGGDSKRASLIAKRTGKLKRKDSLGLSSSDDDDDDAHDSYDLSSSARRNPSSPPAAAKGRRGHLKRSDSCSSSSGSDEEESSGKKKTGSSKVNVPQRAPFDAPIRSDIPTLATYFNDDDDQEPTTAPSAAAAALSSTSTTPHHQRTNRRVSSDNGNGMFSPSARLTVKCPAIPTLSEETLHRIGGKLYPDLRHCFVRRLASYAKEVRRKHWEKNTFDVVVRAIIVVSLHPYPIRSAAACKAINGIGKELQTLLKEATESEGNTPFVPARGKFSAVAPATILALSDYEASQPEEPLCTMEILIRCLNSYLDPRANATLTRDADYYLDINNKDPGWSQIKKLGSSNVHADVEPYVKERRRKGKPVFELTDEGRKLSKQLRSLLNSGPVPPGPLRQLEAAEVSSEYKHVTLSVDFREGGGGKHGLHKMCNFLQTMKVPYVVRELKIADYVFFVGDKLAPYLIERKSIEDVAHSIADGRWERQQRNMRIAQYVLGGGSARKCHVGYIIESDTANVMVHGGKVGRTSWNQTEQDVNSAIDELPKLGFFVIRTKSIMGSMSKLADVAKEVSFHHENNSFNVELKTYETFLSEMRRCDIKEGDPPTDRALMYPGAPVVDQHNAHFERRRIMSPKCADSSSTAARTASSTAAHRANKSAVPTELSEQEAVLQKMSIAELKRQCKERDEPIGGKKGDLIARLLKPKKPALLIVRKKNGDHVPKMPSCNAALLIGLLLNTRPGEGKTKEELMILADATGCSSVAMDRQNGFYDGWAGMSELKKGDPPLICMKKKLYCLTVNPVNSSGRDVARGLHILAHREGKCRCGNVTIE